MRFTNSVRMTIRGLSTRPSIWPALSGTSVILRNGVPRLAVKPDGKDMLPREATDALARLKAADPDGWAEVVRQ